MIAKLLSGRYFLTIIAGIVFATLSITGKLAGDKISEIILIIVYAYFSRQDRNTQNGGGTK
jgi:amino acid permease